MGGQGEKDTIGRGRLRLRFSLLTLLLLMTIVSLGVALWRVGSEVVPLREEVQKLRVEVGKLTILDDEKIYAIQLKTGETNVWRWRIYLPPGKSFYIKERLHRIPGQKFGTSRKQWFQQLSAMRSGSTSKLEPGEFTLEVSLQNDSQTPNYWTLKSDRSDGRNGGGSVGTTIKWLNDRRLWSIAGEVPFHQQVEHPVEDGLVLFTVKKAMLSEENGTYTVRGPDPLADADGLAVWIDLIN